MTLEIITAEALGAMRHGFFTRRGGASSGVFKGLNCGIGSSDQSSVVTLNRERVAQAMDVPAAALVTLHQVHSSRVATLTDPIPSGSIKADALVTATPNIALGTLTADCQPVLLADPKAQVVAAAHAGWKGALTGVLEETVAAMVKAGAHRGDIHAIIGPSISQSAYEVGPEFRDNFCDVDPAYARFFIPGHGDRYQFDLPGFGLHRLQNAGVASAEWTGHCTYSDPSLFYSYRRSVHQKEADYGRLIAAIRLS